MNADLGPYALLPDFVEFMIDGDRAILAAAGAVEPDEYYKDRGISAGSLHKLLVHAMGAQTVWLSRFQGTHLPAIPDVTQFPTRESVAQRWPEVHAALREFVSQQTLETLGRVVAFKTLRGDAASGVLGQLLLHVTDHGTYHRGQQNTLIKLAGGKAVENEVYYYRWRLAHPE